MPCALYSLFPIPHSLPHCPRRGRGGPLHGAGGGGVGGRGRGAPRAAGRRAGAAGARAGDALALLGRDAAAAAPLRPAHAGRVRGAALRAGAVAVRPRRGADVAPRPRRGRTPTLATPPAAAPGTRAPFRPARDQHGDAAARRETRAGEADAGAAGALPRLPPGHAGAGDRGTGSATARTCGRRVSRLRRDGRSIGSLRRLRCAMGAPATRRHTERFTSCPYQPVTCHLSPVTSCSLFPVPYSLPAHLDPARAGEPAGGGVPAGRGSAARAGAARPGGGAAADAARSLPGGGPAGQPLQQRGAAAHTARRGGAPDRGTLRT